MLLAALSLPLTGCVQDIVSPESARTSGPGADPMGGVQLPDPPAPIVGEPGATVGMAVTAGEAATLHAGRFTLYLHKNALKKNAQVTLWVPDPNSMQVEFTVTPAEANDFQVPARVTADLSDLPTAESGKTMYYWDGTWEVPNDVIVDPATHTIMATMHELSTCKVAADPQTINHATN